MNKAIIAELENFSAATKDSAEQSAQNIAKQTGDDSVALAICLQHTINICERARKLITPNVVVELEKLGTGIYLYGAKVETTTSAWYDYSGDSKWSQLKEKESVIAEARKDRESLLKGITEKQTPVLYEGVSEVIDPPLKSASQTVRIIFS